MKLSKNFSLREFTRSATADREGISNDPTEEHIENLKKLCDNVLQPLRDAIGMPIRLTSGYRSKALNEKVGGSTTSDHSHGRAADLELWVDGEEKNAKLYNAIKSLDLPTKQVIWEYGDENEPNWVHVSYEEGNEKRQFLAAYRDSKGRTKYKTI